MNFSRIAQQLSEENPALTVSKNSSEKAMEGGQKQINKTNKRKDRQKAQMASQSAVPHKSDVSYASEEARAERTYEHGIKTQTSDWREELMEAAKPDDQGEHPFVDVMPFVNQKQREAKKQVKAAAEVTGMEGGKMSKMAEERRTNFPINMQKQLEISRKHFEDRKKGKIPPKKTVTPPKDTRSDAQKMTDATGPRPGSRFRGD